MPVTPDAPDDAAELRAQNAGLREANERLRMLLEDKDAKMAEMEERFARLEQLISRNSRETRRCRRAPMISPGRSHRAAQPRRGGKRKPGKQPGAPGTCLAWNDHPDDTIPHFPDGACSCGADLAGAEDLGVRYSHQVTDLPEARAQTIQHDRHGVRCACRLNFQAWCVFLMVMQHPVERCADITEGTRPSGGWVHGLLARAAQAVAAANGAIRALIILAGVICGGETPSGPGPGRSGLVTHWYLPAATYVPHHVPPSSRRVPGPLEYVRFCLPTTYDRGWRSDCLRRQPPIRLPATENRGTPASSKPGRPLAEMPLAARKREAVLGRARVRGRKASRSDPTPAGQLIDVPGQVGVERVYGVVGRLHSHPSENPARACGSTGVVSANQKACRSRIRQMPDGKSCCTPALGDLDG